MHKYNFCSLMRVVALLATAQIAACGSGGGSDPVAAPLPTATPVAISPVSTVTPGIGTLPGTGTAVTGLTCTGVGSVQAMSADPDTGAVDVSEYCLGVINGYRSQKGLAPYYLQSKAPEAICCQAAEAKTAAETGGHANGGCGWKAQGFCGGGRNPNGTVKASVDYCPKLFYQEGPAVPPNSNHYTAMMEPSPRGVMCSFYGVSRDKHSIVVNYY